MNTTAAAAKTPIVPVVGMGASFGAGSDSYPATIVSVSKSGKKVGIQQDAVVAAGEWREGEYENDLYTTVPNAAAAIQYYTLRDNGRWIAVGAPKHAHWASLSLGVRRYRQDPHF